MKPGVYDIYGFENVDFHTIKKNIERKYVIFKWLNTFLMYLWSSTAQDIYVFIYSMWEIVIKASLSRKILEIQLPWDMNCSCVGVLALLNERADVRL